MLYLKKYREIKNEYNDIGNLKNYLNIKLNLKNKK